MVAIILPFNQSFGDLIIHKYFYDYILLITTDYTLHFMSQLLIRITLKTDTENLAVEPRAVFGNHLFVFSG